MNVSDYIENSIYLCYKHVKRFSVNVADGQCIQKKYLKNLSFALDRNISRVYNVPNKGVKALT